VEAFYNANLALANPATAQFRWGIISNQPAVVGTAANSFAVASLPACGTLQVWEICQHQAARTVTGAGSLQTVHALICALWYLSPLLVGCSFYDRDAPIYTMSRFLPPSKVRGMKVLAWTDQLVTDKLV
jgi:hypothetical protein